MMTYTVQSAGYADPDRTSVVLMTDEAGLVLISSLDAPDEWAELMVWGESNQIAAYVPPLPPAFRLFKSVFISRLNEAEAQTLEAVLGQASAKLRLLFNSVEYFVSDDPLFAELHAAVAAALGAPRADELLSA